MIHANVPYRIESELTSSRPRRVRFTAATQTRRLRSWCLSLLPCVVVLAHGLHAAESDDALLTRGKVIKACVTSVTVVDSGRSTATEFVGQVDVMFKFRVNGIDMIGKEVDEDGFRQRPKIGDAIEVTYLPENPRTFVPGRVSHWRVVQRDLDWILSSAALAIIGLAYVILVERYFCRQKRLLRDGKAVAATVVGHQTAESGETATYFVRYEYPDSKGKKIAGRLAVNPKRARAFPDGSRLTILCLPDSSEPGTPYVSITEAEIVKGS